MYHPSITELMSLFEGYQHAYGTYKLTGEVEGAKILGKATSIKGEVTVELWHRHLMGSQGLGIIPIREDSMVKFAAIDIDEYPLNMAKIVKELRDAKIPLVPCRTKSGGAHLYLFLTEFHDAKSISSKMREIASYLGFGSSEIYPRQTKIMAERGDIGQWINMPYFLAAKTKRFALNRDNRELSLDEFVKLAQETRQVPLEFLALKLTEGSDLPGGPPCLRHLIRTGFPSGTRNNGLFNLGVYLKKANPDGWQRDLEKYNTDYMDPPLTSIEVLGVMKSLNKKEFTYMCEQPPIRQFCDRDKCRMCEFGIGRVSAGFPRFGTLTKLNTVPAIWFLEVENGGRLELTTEDLQSPLKFQNRCMDVLNIMPEIPKRDTWTQIVRKLLEEVSVIDMPEESTPRGMFLQHLEEFCTSRVSGRSSDDLVLGKPYTTDGIHHFRVKDLMDYLDRNRFKLLDQSQIIAYLRDLGADKKFFNIKGKGINCYAIPEFKNRVTQPLDVVEQKEKPFE